MLELSGGESHSGSKALRSHKSRLGEIQEEEGEEEEGDAAESVMSDDDPHDQKQLASQHLSTPSSDTTTQRKQQRDNSWTALAMNMAGSGSTVALIPSHRNHPVQVMPFSEATTQPSHHKEDYVSNTEEVMAGDGLGWKGVGLGLSGKFPSVGNNLVFPQAQSTALPNANHLMISKEGADLEAGGGDIQAEDRLVK